MKRPAKIIVTVTVALILVGSLAYAAEKKKQEKEITRTPQAAEEEAVKAELLAAVEGHQEKLPGVDEKVDAKKVVNRRAGVREES